MTIIVETGQTFEEVVLYAETTFCTDRVSEFAETFTFTSDAQNKAGFTWTHIELIWLQSFADINVSVFDASFSR